MTAEDDTRERLIAAASSLFAERGFEGASTREIAARAAANQGLIQYHFGGKDGLWREAVDRGLDALANALSGCPADAPAPQRVAALLAAFIHNPEPLQILIHALLEPGPRRDFLLGERLAALRAAAVRWLTPDAPQASAPPDPVFVWMWLGAAIAPAAFAPALSALAGRPFDHRELQRVQRVALEPWLRGDPLLPHAGPWSLAAARRRRAARSPA